jgi:hypothetical protein
MSKDGRVALDAIVQPTCAVTGTVEVNRCRLTAGIGRCIEEGDVKNFRVLG